MIMKVVFQDNSWIIGKRGWREIGIPMHETKGTHHFTVIDSSDNMRDLRKREVAIPINSAKYFILNYIKES